MCTIFDMDGIQEILLLKQRDVEVQSEEIRYQFWKERVAE